MALSSLKVLFLCHFAFSLRYPKTIPDTCCLIVRKVKSKHVVTDSPEGGFFCLFSCSFCSSGSCQGWRCWVRVQCRQRHFSSFRRVSNILFQSFMGIAPPLALSHNPGRKILIMGLVSQVNNYSWWKPCSHTSASDVD